MSELRIENVPEETYTFNCYGCGKTLTLWYNGGELDGTRCCGYAYDLQSRGIDFVVRPDPTPAAPDQAEGPRESCSLCGRPLTWCESETLKAWVCENCPGKSEDKQIKEMARALADLIDATILERYCNPALPDDELTQRALERLATTGYNGRVYEVPLRPDGKRWWPTKLRAKEDAEPPGQKMREIL